MQYLILEDFIHKVEEERRLSDNKKRQFIKILDVGILAKQMLLLDY
jgi:hypothetical protein